MSDSVDKTEPAEPGTPEASLPDTDSSSDIAEPSAANTEAPSERAEASNVSAEASVASAETSGVSAETAATAVVEELVADPVLLDSREFAREALSQITEPQTIGSDDGHEVHEAHVLTLYFECRLPGYPGWRWAATITRVDEESPVTVLEAELLPGGGAVVAPEWLPWSERLAQYRDAQAKQTGDDTNAEVVAKANAGEQDADDADSDDGALDNESDDDDLENDDIDADDTDDDDTDDDDTETEVDEDGFADIDEHDLHDDDEDDLDDLGDDEASDAESSDDGAGDNAGEEADANNADSNARKAD